MNQLRRNVTLLAVLAVVAGALGLFAYFGVLRGEERDRERQKAESKFASSGTAGEDGRAPAPLDYTKVVIETKDGATTLIRQDDGWRIVAPVNAAADAFVMDAVKSTLDSLELSKVIEETAGPAELKKYGLDAPAFTVRVTGKPRGGGAEKELGLKGGGENPFDGSIYVQREGDPRVYAVPGGVRFSLMKTTAELRDRQIFRVPAKEITRIEVTTPSRTFAVEKQGKVWKLLKPETGPADAQAITAFLGALANERVVSFGVDSSEARTAAGLDAPLVRATFTREKGEAIRIDLGRPAPADDAGAPPVFALRMDGHDTVLAEVGPGALAAFEKDPATLRDRSVVSFEKDKVAKLEFVRPGAPRIVVVRELADGGSLENWRVVEPRGGPAKKFKMTSILWTLGSLKAQELREENPPSWAKWGLDKPAQEARLYDASGAVLATLSVGKEVEGQSGVSYARGTRNQVVEMKTERLVDLPSSVEDVLDAVADGG